VKRPVEAVSGAIQALRLARKIVVAIVGGTVVLLGIVLFLTPGPATLVIPLGLAILATEFVWARRVLKRFREAITALRRRLY